MKSTVSIWLLTILSVTCVADTGSGDLSERFIALAIQGDLREAPALFEGLDSDAASAELALRERFQQRFVDRRETRLPTSGNALVDAVIVVYREYWTDRLLQPPPHATSDREPGQALVEALAAHGWRGRAGSDALNPYALLDAALEQHQVYAYAGPAPPLQDLLIWNTQTTSEFEVELTDTVRSVKVVFMSDFYSQGWKHFATLGLATTTGWVEDGTLYCVEWAYAPGTEAFDVSYLKHETRHLADLERFPDLPSVDLEYRAKLTELAFAGSTQRRLLDDFTAKSAANPSAPHAEANHRVTRDLWRELYGKPFAGGEQAWMSVSRGKVNRAARRLLERNTAELMRQQ